MQALVPVHANLRTRSNIEYATNFQVAVNTCISTYGTHHNTDVPCSNSTVNGSQPMSHGVGIFFFILAVSRNLTKISNIP